MPAHQHDARETPTMNELLAACAAASAVSTPPDAPEESRKDRPEPRKDRPAAAAEESPADGGDTPASTPGRTAA
ncbi:hypothetical protein [Streptomyces endophytica]|uniref:Uncharacterized protein n=1 Tax=Streptomyces endophytica TaxID=2991496 RepID=A0ABY6PAK1_9ACTN|nr:hypothetical protein [Streptomyces endophytica]UZJ30855.1 hypothetical protein OJ254_11470 [Streptomyces endophytica]